MKKSIFLSIILLIFSLSIVSALSDNAKDIYSPGETMIVKISGNILDSIEKGDLKFYRGHVEVPLDFDLKKLGDNYYFWASAPLNENNYSFVIKDVLTYSEGKQIAIDYARNFSVIGNLTSYSIRPGFIYSDSDFSLTLKLNEDESKSISLDFPIKRNVTIKPGENTLNFEISSVVGEKLMLLKVGEYIVPAYIIGKDPEPIRRSILLNPRLISGTIFISDGFPIRIKLLNNGNTNINDLNIKYNQTIFSLSRTSFSNLDKDSEIDFNLSINQKYLKDNLSIQDSIELIFDNSTLSLPINITLTDNKTNADIAQNNSYNYLYNCVELGGTRCESGTTCSIEGIISKDSVGNNCCKGTCIKPNVKGKSWTGYIIFLIILIVIISILIKYKMTGKKKNPLEKK
jgi:hypothetical protein